MLQVGGDEKQKEKVQSNLQGLKALPRRAREPFTDTKKDL
jgi:hypothetical protein